jgi:dihydroorotate dehydrogenase (fumarate)
MSMPDLTTQYLGLTLRSPLVASASPATGEVERIRRLADAGIAAVVLPSLFEEQMIHDELELEYRLEAGAECSAEAIGYFPELDTYNTGPDRYLHLVELAKDAVSIPVFASLNAVSAGSWVRYAHLVQSAGADALELNLYQVAADAGVTAVEIERRLLDLVREVRSAIDIPLAVKIGPFYSAVAHFATELVDAGADGLVLFNRFYQPDLDLDTLAVTPHLTLSTSAELRLPLRWIGILSGNVRASLAATTGIHTGRDVVKALLVGADVAMMASALLEHGAAHVRAVEAELVSWMEAGEYTSVAQLRGSVSHGSVPDPSAFERLGYLRTLATWR